MGMCIHYVFQIDKNVNLMYYIQIFIHTVKCVNKGGDRNMETEGCTGRKRKRDLTRDR